MQQPTNSRSTYRPTLPRQRTRERRFTLARPAQWRPRVATCDRVNQPLQRLFDTRLGRLDTRSPRPGSTHSTRHLHALLNLSATVTNRFARQPCRRRHQRVTTVPDRHRFSGRPQTTCALVQHRHNRRVLLYNGRFQNNVSIHLRTRS